MRMFSRLACLCLISSALGGILGVVCQPSLVRPADDQPPPAKQYFKGRVAPKNLRHLQAVSYERHGRHLKRMRRILNAPANWDSVAKGYVGPVKSQASCGSCWDFSGTGEVEVAFNVAGVGGGPAKMILSEQYTLSCGRNGGCNGDNNTTVLAWAKSTGIPLTAQYGTYTASAGRCTWKDSQTLYKITDWGFADSSGGQGVTSASDIKAAIMQYGAVGCAVAADDAFSNYRAGSVFSKTTSRDIDHDVMLVGWDDSKSKTEGKTVWKMRNSWGAEWGEDGYMWIGEGINLIGTEAVWAVVTAPAPPPLPPFMGPTQPDNKVVPGVGWSGQVTFENGLLTTILPTTEKKELGGAQPAPAIRP